MDICARCRSKTSPSGCPGCVVIRCPGCRVRIPQWVAWCNRGTCIGCAIKRSFLSYSRAIIESIIALSVTS